MPPTPSSRSSDFTFAPKDSEGLRRDTDNLYNLKSLEEVEVLNERVKVAIENIEIALELAENNQRRRNTDDYEDWKERTQWSLKKYEKSLVRINGYRRKLNEERRIKDARRERLQANLIAAERKREQAIFQLNKNLSFIEVLKKRGIIPSEVLKELWDEAEQIAFDRRQEFKNGTYRKLDADIDCLRRELDALEDAEAVDGTPNAV